MAKTPIKGATISFTGRNLFFFKNDAEGFDPELVLSTDRWFNWHRVFLSAIYQNLWNKPKPQFLILKEV